MRVLIAHNRYRLTGGEERHVELLERGLREAGVDVRRFERDSESRTFAHTAGSDGPRARLSPRRRWDWAGD